MRHGAKPHERLRSLGGTFGGQASMMTLAKRLHHCRGATPENCELVISGPLVEDMHQWGWETRDDGSRVRVILKYWTPHFEHFVFKNESDPIRRSEVEKGSWLRTLRDYAAEALGREVGIQALTRAECFTICEWLCDQLKPIKERAATDWYPDGWRATYDLIRSGVPKVEKSAPVIVSTRDPAAERRAALDAINYVATVRGISEAEVLELANANRHRLTEAERQAVLSLLPEDGAA